jgi:hypothetical protein
MKSFQVILAIAGILLIAGVYVIYPPLPFSNSHSLIIPDGNYFYHLDLSITKLGHISGTFSDSSGNGVIVNVMNDGQFQNFKAGLSTSSLSLTTGISGGFSANILGPGSYHLVLEHDLNTAQQTIQISYQVDGMNPVFLGTGIGLLVAGVALALVGRRSRQRHEPPRKHSDIILFDKPPENNPQPVTPTP